MNILIGKSGVSIKFGEVNDISLGDAFFFAICRQYPQHQFYLGSMSNIDKIDEKVIPANLHWIKKKDMIKDTDHPEKVKDDLYDAVMSLCPNLDLAIIYDSYICNTCRNNATFIQTEIYAKPILHVISKMRLPWICLVDDATILTSSLPIDMHAPKFILSQCNGKTSKRTIKDVDALVEDFNQGKLYRDVKNNHPLINEEINVKYAHLEKIFLNKKERKDFRNLPKTNEWMLAARLNPVRVDEYNKWFGDDTPFESSIKIYTGQKSCKDAERLQLESEHRLFSEMDDLIWDSRFAFISQNQTEYPGFVTQKFWDMVYHGVIPFFDKSMYDTENLLNAPEICKVSNSDELYARCQRLMSNEEEYRKVLNDLWNLLDEKYFSENFLREIFDEILNINNDTPEAKAPVNYYDPKADALF